MSTTFVGSSHSATSPAIVTPNVTPSSAVTPKPGTATRRERVTQPDSDIGDAHETDLGVVQFAADDDAKLLEKKPGDSFLSYVVGHDW